MLCTAIFDGAQHFSSDFRWPVSVLFCFRFRPVEQAGPLQSTSTGMEKKREREEEQREEAQRKREDKRGKREETKERKAASQQIVVPTTTWVTPATVGLICIQVCAMYWRPFMHKLR
mmetsp:Transcript_90442/g.174092  ORF Transcript_90442/g.174092 Transcript_90442/m.174092 type:complete len:117 (+) Transcript_90442:1156-1506(+)